MAADEKSAATDRQAAGREPADGEAAGYVSLLQPRDTPRENAPEDAPGAYSVRDTIALDAIDLRQCQLDRFMIVVIVLNTLQVGAEHQWKTADYPSLEPVYCSLDIMFAALYVMEVCVNLVFQRWEFFTRGWNIADLSLTILAVYSAYVRVMHIGDKRLANMKLLRLVRFIRIIRVLRVIKEIPDLVMVIEGLIKAMKSLFWVLIMLSTIIYAFAILLTIEIGDGSQYGSDFQADYFSDMGHAMLTLMDIAILAEWGEIVRPIMKHQPLLLPFFLAFALLSSFGMLNVMIGVIVDSTAEARKELEDQHKRDQIENASTIWKDTIHDRGLSTEAIARESAENGNCMEAKRSREMERHAAINDILQQILDAETINFPHGLTPDDVISLLDFDASGHINHAEFVDGLSRLLLGDGFQLTCLILTVVGKLRKERAEGQSEVLTVLDNLARGQSDFQRQLDNISGRLDEITARAAARI